MNPNRIEEVSDLLRRCGHSLTEIRFDTYDDEAVAILGKINAMMLAHDYLFAVDIIDLLAATLKETIREGDYLRSICRREGCLTCMLHKEDDPACCDAPERCVIGEDGCCEGYKYAGVPENWSVQQ